MPRWCKVFLFPGKLMSNPKKQHYVPKFLLRNFADDKGKIFSCRADDKRNVFQTSVDDVFTMNYVHSVTLEDGSKFPKFEGEFIEEDIAPPMLKKILDEMRTRRAPRLDKSEKEALIECVGRLATRDPEFFGKVSEDQSFDCKIRDTIERYSKSEEERRFLSQPDELSKVKHEVRASALPMRPERFIAELSNYGFVFQKLRSNVPPLIIGNQFWVVDRQRVNAMPWLPIAHDAMLGFWGEPGTIEFNEVGHSALIRRANTAIASQSRQIAGRSEADIGALAKHLTNKPRGSTSKQLFVQGHPAPA